MRFIAGDTGPKPASEGPVHLLIVDDDAAVVEMTRLVLRDRMLVGRPVVTHTARSAAEARAFLTADPPPIAVAIIDVVMESQDAGLKLVQWIRDTPSLQEMRIVIRTGQPGQASESRVGASEIVFAVENVRGAHAALRARGVEFRNEPRNVTGTEWAANFTDPDGHAWEVYTVLDEVSPSETRAGDAACCLSVPEVASASCGGPAPAAGGCC